jgi:hypothetical protein
MLKKALLELSKDQTFIITKADKGNAVVIQNKTDYKKKVNNLLTSTGKFKELNGETIKRETRLQNYLRSISVSSKNGSSEINEEVYNEIMPCGSRAGIMYGLSKIH